MIFEKVISWIVSIVIILYIPYTIYFNIIQISSKWKCRKKNYLKPFHSCHENNCKFAKYCEDYEYIYTADETKELNKMIEELKNDI